MEKAKNKNVNAIKKIWNNPNFKSYSGIILVIIVVSLFMNFRSPNFMTYNNIMNILRQIAVYGILACGMAFTMMTGGIDLTVGSIAGVSADGRKFSTSSSCDACRNPHRCGSWTHLRNNNRIYRNSAFYYDSWISDNIKRCLLSDYRRKTDW